MIERGGINHKKAQKVDKKPYREYNISIAQITLEARFMMEIYAL